MKLLKRMIGLILAGMMALTCVACDKNMEIEDTVKHSDNGDNVGVESNSVIYNVFKEQGLDLGIDWQNVRLTTMTYQSNQLHMLFEDFSGSLAMGETNAEYGNSGYYKVSVKIDGNEQELIPLQFNSNEMDGSISCAKFLDDGNLVALYETSVEDADDILYWEPKYLMLKWDCNGKLLWNKEIKREEQEVFYAPTLCSGKSGNIVIITENNDFIVFDSDGNELSEINMVQLGINNVRQVIAQKDGSIHVIHYNNEWTQIYVSEIDLVSGNNLETVELPQTLINYSLCQGETTDFFASNANGLYTYNIGDAEPVQVMDFLNSDLSCFELNDISFINEQEFIATYNDTADGTFKVSRFTHVDNAEVAEKINLVLGCEYMTDTLNAQIVAFNKTSEKYRITIKNYDDYNTMEDYTLGTTQLNNDIIAGNMPDILVFNSSMNISYMANKGLLADVGELISKDKELADIEYLSNVFEAFSVNDKMYAVIPAFSVQTMVARKDMVGNRMDWTMSEFNKYMSTLSDDVKPFGNLLTRNDLMYYIMQYCGGDFMDVNTGNCNYNNPEFISLLEFVKTFPTRIAVDVWENYDWVAAESIYRDKKAVLKDCYIWNIQQLVYDIHGALGAEAFFVGFPGIEGNSSVIVSDSDGFVISAKSENIEGAWSFVRYFLTEEYQRNEQLEGLPVMKKAFEEQLMQAMEKPYWINEETGQKVYEDYTYLINNEEVILEPFTQKEVDEIRNFIYSIENRGYYDYNILNIVTEEAAAFFGDSKSAEEVAEIIQNRVQVYVDEKQ